MARKSFPMLIVLLALASIVGSVPADTLVLRSGKSLDGTFVGASRDIVHLSVEGEIRQIAVDEVASIRFDKERETPRGLDPGGGPAGRAVIVGAGALVTVAFSQRILAGDLREGQVFRSKLAQPFKSGDTLLAPAGSDVYGKIVQHESGAAGMILTQMVVAGERVSIRTEPRQIPQAGESLEKVDFRIDRPFTLRVATTR